MNWSISHSEQLVVVHVQDEIQPSAVEALFSALVAEGALPCRKLVDLSFAPLTHGVAGIRAIAQRVRAVANNHSRGPVAVVATSELACDLTATFDTHMSVDRPLRIFANAKAARQWLDEVEPLRSSV